jgi:predicted O-methyltransferase YrrM
MIDISRALTIDGWMQPEELAWLAEQAQRRKFIVEIGSYLGRSTRALADNALGIVYAIDDWHGPRDVDWLTKEQRRAIAVEFKKNIEGSKARVEMISCDHATASISETPDMVFIDGDHEYASVMRDINRWYGRLAPGGLLCGHDVNHVGVAQAVRHTFGKYAIAPNTTIWYVEI